MSASEGRVLASDRELKDSDESSSSGAKSKSQYQQQRQRRNPAVLIRWIEEHPYNPYPTKSEKHYLSFYSGMTQRQLNDWFANARRNIKKVGYESWKKKHSGFSAILSGIPLQGPHFPVQAASQPLLSTSPGYKRPASAVSNVYGGGGGGTSAATVGMHAQPENDCNASTTGGGGTQTVPPSYYSSLSGMKFVQLSHGPAAAAAASYAPSGGIPPPPPVGDSIVLPAVQTAFPFPWAHSSSFQNTIPTSSYKLSSSTMHNGTAPCACPSECQPLAYPPLSRASETSSPTSEDTSHQFSWSPGSSLSTSEAPPYVGYTQGHSLAATPLMQGSSAVPQWKSPDPTLKIQHNRVTTEETDGSTTDEGYFDDSAGISS